MQLPSFELERYFARYEFDVEYLLGSSDCEAWTIQQLLDLEPGADEAFASHWLGYTDSRGSPALRAAICDLYDRMRADNILVHSGAEEAIYLFMHAVLQPGDHAIVHWPCYQSLFDVAKATGAEVSVWSAEPHRAWTLDLNELENLFRTNTRVVVLNTPHNPTGYLMAHQEYFALHALVQERRALLLSDEVYRGSEYMDRDRLPAACDRGEHAVSLGVMSKIYGLAGLRIGWIATQNATVLERMAMLKDFTTICNSAPSEFLAELALRHRHSLLERNLGIIRHNLDVLDDFFDGHAHLFEWQRPKAGAIAFPRLLEGDVDGFCSDLVERSGVMLVPGSLFGDHRGHFRIGFGRKNLPQAIGRLGEFLGDAFP